MSLLGAYKILIAINLEQKAAVDSEATNQIESATAESTESIEIDRLDNYIVIPGNRQNEGDSSDR